MRGGLVFTLIIIIVTSSIGILNEINSRQDEPEVLTIATNLGVTNFFNHLINPVGGPLQWLFMVHASLYSRVDSPLTDWNPDLAEEEPDEDPKQDGTAVLHVKLKEDLRFASGSPITLEDVVFSYRVMLTPNIQKNSFWNILHDFFENQDSISVDGDKVRFDFKLWNIFSKRVLNIPIIEKQVYQSFYDDCVSGNLTSCDWNRNDGFFAQGAGPYRFVSFTNKTIDEVLVEKNPYYHDHKNVFIDQILFKHIKTLDTALELQRNSTIDIWNHQYNLNNEIKNEFPEIDLYDALPLSSEFIFVNHKHPVFGTGVDTPLGLINLSNADFAAKSIRKAFAHTINHSFVVDLLQGKAIPAPHDIPIGVDGYDQSLQIYEFNIETAMTYMEQAGYDYDDLEDSNNDGIFESFFFNVSILTADHEATRALYIERFAQDLAKIGVEANFQVISLWGEFVFRLFTPEPQPLYADGGYDLMAAGVTSDKEYDPNHNYTSLWPKVSNYNNYQNESLGETINQYWTEFNRAQRNSVFEEMQFHLHDNVVNIPIVYLIPTYGVHCRALDVTDRLDFDNQIWKSIRIDYEFCSEGIEAPSSSINFFGAPVIYYLTPGVIALGIMTYFSVDWLVKHGIRRGVVEADKIKQEEAEHYLDRARKLANEEYE